MGDTHVALQARLISQAQRKLTGTVSRSRCLLMFTNQIRMKIGVMFGSPETTSGGNALKFYASVRLDVRRIGSIKEANQERKGEMTAVGNRTRVKVVKNKMAPPFREVEFDILYGQGISRSGEILDMAADTGIVQKSGAWYSFEGERIGQGRDNARTYLEAHPDLLAKLESRILVHYKINRSGGVGSAESPNTANGKGEADAGGDKGAKGGASADAAKEAATGNRKPSAARVAN
jgi:recombination protein RecA